MVFRPYICNPELYSWAKLNDFRSIWAIIALYSSKSKIFANFWTNINVYLSKSNEKRIYAAQ